VAGRIVTDGVRLADLRDRLDPHVESGTEQFDPCVRADVERLHFRPGLRRAVDPPPYRWDYRSPALSWIRAVLHWAACALYPAGLQPHLRRHEGDAGHAAQDRNGLF